MVFGKSKSNTAQQEPYIAKEMQMILENFWTNSAYSKKNYEETFLEENIKKIEAELGYTLPASYIYFMKEHNGGTLKKRHFKINESTSIELEGFFSIGETATHSILGAFGSLFWIDVWGYPDIGIYICDTSSGGHDMICLDYSANKQKPAVVHVDQSNNYKVTFLAEDFEVFIGKLRNEDNNETPEGYVWHYMNNYNKENNTISMQLVNKEIHMQFPHIDYEKQ